MLFTKNYKLETVYFIQFLEWAQATVGHLFRTD